MRLVRNKGAQGSPFLGVLTFQHSGVQKNKNLLRGTYTRHTILSEYFIGSVLNKMFCVTKTTKAAMMVNRCLLVSDVSRKLAFPHKVLPSGGTQLQTGKGTSKENQGQGNEIFGTGTASNEKKHEVKTLILLMSRGKGVATPILR